MTIEQSLEAYGLFPNDAALPIIRQMLAHEAELEREGGERQVDLALLCCVQLFNRRFPEDSILIWQAKNSGFDLDCYLDIHLTCGAGLEATKRYLSEQTSPEAAQALEDIISYEESDWFVGWSPAHQSKEYQRYFESAGE